MCGINGEIRFDDQSPDMEFIAKASEMQFARGPDDGGTFQQGRVAFGHRRLKIMDLSAASQQPMFDPSLGLCIAFNGAIYNYPQLKLELESKGYQFYSNGDTEVILKAYHAWGMDMLQKLNGMFAFAIWERDSGKVVIARDRLGIKPLYFTKDASKFRFASSLVPLAKAKDFSAQIDPVALNFYLNFHSIVPAPNTIIKGIEKLEPGHYLTIDAKGNIEKSTYWQLNEVFSKQAPSHSVEEWKEGLTEQLLNAVRCRNVAAVEVGILLSGGVDSSLLVGLLAEINAENFQTFSIGFEARGGEKGDEFEYSDIIAEHFSTRHHKISIPEAKLLDALPNAISAMAEPMVSHDCVAFYLLSREVKKHCSVVQSGQGADEIFAGYHWYPPMMDCDDAVSTYRQAFFDRSFEEYQNTVNANWRSQDHALDYVTREFSKANKASAINKALYLDTTTMLIDDPVKRVDNMTMAASLEARVPFLDHELVEYAAGMPAELKVRDGGKWILKEVARDFIPSAVIDRPKGYFPVPALKYLQGPILEHVKSALHNQAAANRGLFSSAYVDSLLQDPEAHLTPLRGSKLWQLGLLELWLQSHDI